MLENKEIMNLARRRLSGNWLTPIFASILFIVGYILLWAIVYIPINSLFGKNTSYIIDIVLEIFLIAPTYIGFAYLFYKIVTSDNANIADAFKPVGFVFKKDKRKTYWRNLRALLLLGVCSVVIYGICFIPMFFSLIGSQDQVNNLNGFFYVTFAISMILVSIAMILFVPTYNAFLYKLATDESINAIPCLKQSYKVTVGNRYQYWCLNFRFIGWALLCCVTFGIALLWVVPFIYTSYTIFCKELFDKYNATTTGNTYVSAEDTLKEESQKEETLPEE